MTDAEFVEAMGAAAEYKMLMQKQPGTEGHEVTIYINGKQVDKFNLETDRELKYKI